MNASENNPLPLETGQAEPVAKKSFPRKLLVPLIWLVVCSGILTTLVRAIQAAREAARCDLCSCHLKLVGLALQNFDANNGSLPPAYLCDENGKPTHSWRTLTAPYMSHYHWRGQYSLKEPWDGPNNRKLFVASFDEHRCPSVDIDNRSRQTVDYVAVAGPDTMWPGADRVPLGAGNQDTILLIEMPDSDCRCLDPRCPTVEEFMTKIKSPTGKGIRCIHPKGLAYLTARGEVRWFPPNTDSETVRKLLKRDPSYTVIPAKEKIKIVEGWEQSEDDSK
jgi:hypothetical protein